MKWALIYILGASGTFETGLTFDSYAACRMADIETYDHVYGFEEYRVGKPPKGFHFGTVPDIQTSIDWVENNKDRFDNDKSPSMLVRLSRAREQKMRMQGSTQYPHSLQITGVCLPTNEGETNE